VTERLKKAELHCHIEGAAPPALALAQAEKYGVDSATFMRDGTYAWTDFAEFIKAYDRVAALFRTEEDYALLTETYLRELAAVDTIYSEIIVSPDHGDRIGLGADSYHCRHRGSEGRDGYRGAYHRHWRAPFRAGKRDRRG
jgi:adenosine deaminase